MGVFQAILALLLIAIFYFVYRFIIKPYRLYKYYTSIPGFRGEFKPLIGFFSYLQNNIKLYNDVLGSYKVLPLTDPDARAQVLAVGDRVTIQLYDIDLIRSYYKQQDCYRKVQISQQLDRLIGKGLFSAEGKVWKKHRKIISSTFHFEFIKQNVGLVVQIVRQHIGELKKKSSDELQAIDALSLFQSIAAEIVATIFFGDRVLSFEIEGKKLSEQLVHIMRQIGNLNFDGVQVLFKFLGLNQLILPSSKVVVRQIDHFRACMFKLVQERKASKTRSNDLLQVLLDTQSKTNPEDIFSDEDIVDEFVTFFFGGIDTTSHTLIMLIYSLATSTEPKYLQNINKEINEVYSKFENPDYETINQLNYSWAVLKETMRFYSPAPGPVTRVSLRKHTLGDDVNIQNNLGVRPNPVYNLFNPKYFPNPTKFDPERWLDQDFVQKMDPYMFLPFSAGPRNCIGQHLAIIEGKVILCEFIKNFKFEIEKDYKLTMVANFVYENQKPILLKLTKR